MKGSLFRLAVFAFALATLFTMFSSTASAADKPPADSLAWAWAVSDRGASVPAKPAPAVSANKCDVCGPACPCPAGACASGNCPTGGVVTIEGKPYTFANGSYWPVGYEQYATAQSSEPRKPKFFNKDGSVCVECEAAETAYLARQAAKAGTVSPVSFATGSACASGNCGVSQGGFTYAAGSLCASGNCGTATGFGSSQLTTVQGFGARSGGGLFHNIREARAERKAARSGGCAVCK